MEITDFLRFRQLLPLSQSLRLGLAMSADEGIRISLPTGNAKVTRRLTGNLSPDNVFALPEEKPEKLSLPPQVHGARSTHLLLLGFVLTCVGCLASVLTTPRLHFGYFLWHTHDALSVQATMPIGLEMLSARFDLDLTSDDCIDICIDAQIGRMRCLSICGAIPRSYLDSYPPII